MTAAAMPVAVREPAVVAVDMGLRANATAMAVPRSMREVCSAAMASGRKGSERTSALQPPS